MDPNKSNLSAPMFFVTAAVVGWKHLFANEACTRIVLDSLEYLTRRRQLDLYVFALLPSHLNLLCRPRGGDIRKVIEGFADFTASRMAAVLRRRRRGPLMQYLHVRSGGEGGSAPIWGELRIEEVRMQEKCRSLMNRIHNKPLLPQWRLAAVRSKYPYSSACFYDEGRTPVIPVQDARREF